jgi:hypothetical protein
MHSSVHQAEILLAALGLRHSGQRREMVPSIGGALVTETALTASRLQI